MPDLVEAALYLRQSSDRAGDEKAVDRQREDCEALCRRMGWVVRWRFVDNDVSATSRKKRPAYQQMLAAVESGEVKAIAAWHLDRLHRRPAELGDFIDLADRKKVLLATASGEVDLSTPMGRMVARVMGATARHEMEQKSARQKLSNRQAAKQGRPPGGRRAFGYERGGTVIREEEAVLIRSGMDRLLSGASLRSIAAEWNATGLTPDGRFGPKRVSKEGAQQKTTGWQSHSVRYVLTNPRYAGVSVYEGVEYPGAWPAVISEDLWRSTTALLSDPSRRTSPSNARRYLLSGYATCHCGALATTGRTQRGKRTYRCSEHRHMTRAAEPVDNFVRAVVIERLSRADAADLLVDPRRKDDAEQARSERMVLARRSEEAAAAFATGDITTAQIAAINRSITEQLRVLDGALFDDQRSAALAGLIGDPEKAWDEMAGDVGRQRGVISTLFDIELGSPGQGARNFDPATVAIRWKDHLTA